MYRNKKTQQQEQEQYQHQHTSHRPLYSSPLSLLKLFYLKELPKKHNCQVPKYHLSHQHHRQKHKARQYFPHCGLISLIFLSVIKDALTTTYSTSNSLSLDVITMPPQANSLPYFDFDVQRNITVTVGQTGFLHCRVERLGDKDVSWIRKRDLHILTAGSTTYTSDQRFQVLRPENSKSWTLQIKYPQPRDSGIYECQINTEPKMSLSYTFNVVELVATIIGPSDLYVKSGSDINLICKIMQGPHELGNIFWYKGSEIIDMTANQNEIDSGTRIMMESDWSDGLTSRLQIRKASSSDTGNYTCVPTIAKSSSVYVHVIIGEHPAAMQHNSSNTLSHHFFICICCMLFTILMCFLRDLMYLCTKNNRVNRAKNTATTTKLSRKGNFTSVLLLSVANVAATLQSASASASASTSKQTIEKTTGLTKITPSIQHILSFVSFAKAKQFSLSELFQRSAIINRAVAAFADTYKKRWLLFSNGRNAR